MIPIRYSIDKCGLPIIVSSSTPHLCFLVDTGASHNIIFSYVLQSLQLGQADVSNSQSIMGIDGSINQAHQIELSITFENETIKSTYSVLYASKAISLLQTESGIQIHGILGIPFLTQNEWILDFKHLTINTEVK